VVLFSCVRTSSSGIGFVKDVRRMNVALTRARLAMWVVGHAGALRKHPAWAKLLDDAGQRQRLCTNASPDGLAQLMRGVDCQPPRERLPHSREQQQQQQQQQQQRQRLQQRYPHQPPPPPEASPWWSTGSRHTPPPEEPPRGHSPGRRQAPSTSGWWGSSAR